VAPVLVTRRLPAPWLALLVRAGHDLVQPAGDRFGHDDLVARAGDVEAILCLLFDRIDADVLGAGAAGALRVVGTVAVGYDNIDVATAHRLGIAVCNTPGVLDDATADVAFLLVLAAARRASEAEADLRAGRWEGGRFDTYFGVDVHSAVLGIVGYGRIGRAVARRAVGFGMDAIHHTRRDTGVAGWVADLDVLLARSDIVSLHVPLTDATQNLIDARRLSLMKPTAVLVNTARGPVVDEVALAAALENGKLFAAGLDVFTHEPAVNPRLLAAPHTTLLPHIGSATDATRRQMAELACDGIVAVLAGEVPPNLVTG
jgi:glyoxylate reductase